MVSLYELRSPAVALDWHEAVALAAALASLVVEANAGACPAPDVVTLLASGELRITGPATLPGGAAPGIAHVLDGLLEAAPCPAELRQLVDRYAEPEPGLLDSEAAATLLVALGFFERPGRVAVLAAVAERAASALERAQRAAALEALTERTRVAAGAPARPEPALPIGDPPREAVGAAAAASWSEPAAPPLERRAFLPAVVAGVVFLGMAYAAASWLAPAAPVPTAERLPPEDIEVGAAASPEPGAAPRQVAPPGETPPKPTAPTPTRLAAPAAPAADPAPAPTAVTPAAAAPAPASASVPGPAPATVRAATPASQPRPAVDIVVAERDGRVIVPAPAAPSRGTGRVFSAADPAVTPAVLIRPHLPEQPPPDVPEEQIGTLEFVVTETGAVEHVHLVSPANRYQERMLVAAAKTWQFQPATRDGRPVRFRTRIRVTL
jgi:hypothetical protein